MNVITLWRGWVSCRIVNRGSQESKRSDKEVWRVHTLVLAHHHGQESHRNHTRHSNMSKPLYSNAIFHTHMGHTKGHTYWTHQGTHIRDTPRDTHTGHTKGHTYGTHQGTHTYGTHQGIHQWATKELTIGHQYCHR